jgi:hypothetical protein
LKNSFDIDISRSAPDAAASELHVQRRDRSGDPSSCSRAPENGSSHEIPLPVHRRIVPASGALSFCVEAAFGGGAGVYRSALPSKRFLLGSRVR